LIKHGKVGSGVRTESPEDLEQACQTQTTLRAAKTAEGPAKI